MTISYDISNNFIDIKSDPNPKPNLTLNLNVCQSDFDPNPHPDPNRNPKLEQGRTGLETFTWKCCGSGPPSVFWEEERHV